MGCGCSKTDGGGVVAPEAYQKPAKARIGARRSTTKVLATAETPQPESRAEPSTPYTQRIGSLSHRSRKAKFSVALDIGSLEVPKEEAKSRRPSPAKSAKGSRSVRFDASEKEDQPDLPPQLPEVVLALELDFARNLEILGRFVARDPQRTFRVRLDGFCAALDVQPGDALMGAVYRLFEDEDGALDYRELLCGLMALSLESAADRARLAFAVYDVECRDRISRADLVAMLLASWGASRPLAVLAAELRRALVGAGLRRTKELSFDQFTACCVLLPDLVPSREALARRVAERGARRRGRRRRGGGGCSPGGHRIDPAAVGGGALGRRRGCGGGGARVPRGRDPPHPRAALLRRLGDVLGSPRLPHPPPGRLPAPPAPPAPHLLLLHGPLPARPGRLPARPRPPRPRPLPRLVHRPAPRRPLLPPPAAFDADPPAALRQALGQPALPLPHLLPPLGRPHRAQLQLTPSV